MAYGKGPSSPRAAITRRDFLSTAATFAGGVMVFSLPGQAFATEKMETNNSDSLRTKFEDSLGRSLDIAAPVKTVVPIGIYAQTLMETLYPGALASLAKDVTDDAGDFADAGLADILGLDETGTPRGNFGKDVDPVQIATFEPDMILQAGIPRAGVGEELEPIQSATDTPCVFLDISFGKLQETYRKLGCLLGCEERAEELARYIEDAQARAMAAVPKDGPNPKVFYGPRVAGKKVTEGAAIQLDAISQLGMEPLTRPYDFELRTVDFTVLAEEDPDFILLDDTSFPDAFYSCEGEVHELWKGIRAISEGRFAVAPALMHSVLGSAVFAQSIGMLWIASVTPTTCSKLDIAAEMARYYQLFYGLERDEAAMARLLGIGAEDE
jgi:iron complex transport system substrate-binding protein